MAGVPAIDVRYTYNPAWPLKTYPLYHSAYETFHAVDNYIDVGFKVSIPLVEKKSGHKIQKWL